MTANEELVHRLDECTMDGRGATMGVNLVSDIRAALSQTQSAQDHIADAGKMIPVMGEPVAYRIWDGQVEIVRLAKHVDPKRLIAVSVEPIYTLPTNSITAAELEALINLVEGLPAHDWRNQHGQRIKDTPEWVKFYCAVKNATRKPS